MPTNKFAGKYKEGTFSNGEGPVLGQEIKREAETSGDLNKDNMSSHTLKEVGGKSSDSGRSEEKGFDIHGAGYKGPENWSAKSE
mgnify:CR=1 FL=1